MSEDDLRSMYDQIKKQYDSIDWNSLGKSELYTFNLSEKEFEWCYSARALQQDIESLVVGQQIKSIYVSAANYLDPLHERENYVNYLDTCSQTIIVLDNVIIELWIYGHGLFSWRYFHINIIL